MNYKTLLRELSRNAIKLGFDGASNTPVPIGASKFGGRPDLPEGLEWPYYQDAVVSEFKQVKTFKSLFTRGGDRIVEIRKEPADIPLSFLLQINCEEIAEYDTDRLLPDTGMLYFFYELQTMKWGFDPKDKGCARVYYSDTNSFTRRPFPPRLAPECQMPEMPVTFSVKNDLPDWEEIAENYGAEGYNFEEYYEQREEFGYIDDESDRSKLLGYADIIQNDMLLECEQSTNGIYNGDADNRLSDEQRARLSESCKQWKLLLQMDTVCKEGFELMFGDCGHIYYYIRESDLANREFDDCWLILQCY